jgi:uncharacterized integral membrane protein (TIGR00697 family)
MIKLSFNNNDNCPDFTLVLLHTMYTMLVIASILLFNTIIEVNIPLLSVKVSGSVLSYTLLYPIAYITLRIYGYKSVNHMIFSMMITTAIFSVLCYSVTSLQTAANMPINSQLQNILHSAFRMYMAGFIALPAGFYASFFTLTLLEKVNLKFGIISLSIATAIGECTNTLLVFPLGFHGKISFAELVNVVTDALIFKLTIGIVLSILTVLVVNYLINKYEL